MTTAKQNANDNREKFRLAIASYERDQRVIKALSEALGLLYSETSDYIRINNLGDVHHNVSMQMSRAALALAKEAQGAQRTD